MEYTEATEEMVEMVESVVQKYHTRLDGVSIGVISQDKASKSKGAVVHARACLPPKSMKPLLKEHYDFIICIALDSWQTFTHAQKEALIDHELCHCWFGDNGPEMIGHDLEEFAQIIKRHGFWRGNPTEQAVQEAFEFAGVQVSGVELETAEQ